MQQPNIPTGRPSSALILPEFGRPRPGRESSPPAPLTELAPVDPFNNTTPFYKTGLNAGRNHYRSFPMGIFSRTRDIIAANVTDLLDKSQDPAKMIRMIIMEMEETLVEVRASAARTIADKKELQRHVSKLDHLEADWTEKAQLALSKDRDDLAKAALVEKKKATDMAIQLRAEVDVLDDALRASEQDIHKLQKKLTDARARQNALMTRLESAENQVKLRTMYNGDKVRNAFSRFDELERQVDEAQGYADALAIGADKPRTLGDEIDALSSVDEIDEELAAMKKAMKKG